jgi:hypothetical protein
MMTTDQKGAIAETAVAHEATKLGIEVYLPIAEGGRFDMIFLLGNDLVRVQCKWAPRHGDAILVRCYSCRRAREGLRRRGYAAEEIDAIAAYCPDNERCYYFHFIGLVPESRSSFAWPPPRTTNDSEFIGLGSSSSPLHWAATGP